MFSVIEVPPLRPSLISKIRVLMPAVNHYVLINVSRTRWIERIDGMDRIVELLHLVVATLEDISINRNTASHENWNQLNHTFLYYYSCYYETHFRLNQTTHD